MTKGKASLYCFTNIILIISNIRTKDFKLFLFTALYSADLTAVFVIFLKLCWKEIEYDP